MAGHWAFVFGLLGNIVSFCVFLAPIPTYIQIYKKKSSEGFQSIPYVIALFSAMLWIYYALLKTDTTFLITINSFGVFIETIYVGMHLFYAPKKTRVQTMKMIGGLIVCGFGFIVLFSQFLLKRPSQRTNVVGWICLVFSLCVFVAPLGILRKVIQTKSVEYMPFLLSFFLTLSSVMWFFYGLFIRDKNVAIPNILGFAFGIIQMVLYAMYRKKTKTVEPKLPIVQKQVVILDEKKFPELAEQIIEIVKVSVLSGAAAAVAAASSERNGLVPEAQNNVGVPREIHV